MSCEDTRASRTLSPVNIPTRSIGRNVWLPLCCSRPVLSWGGRSAAADHRGRSVIGYALAATDATLIMRSLPSISVVVPLYNKRDTLTRALDSVLAQTSQDFEIIVVNDGSTDGSETLLAKTTDARIRLFQQTNLGVSAARNRGIGESLSECIAFLDADDTWQPDHLETLLKLREDYPGASIYATGYLFGIGDMQTRTPVIRGIPPDWRGFLPDYFSLAAKSDPPLWTSALAVSSTAIKAIGGFPVGVTAGEDLITWARLAMTGGVAYTAKPTAIFWQAQGHLYKAKPTRAPDPDDIVGRGLQQLLLSAPRKQKAGLRQYIALWHKMRASIYMRLGEHRASAKEAVIAIRNDPLAWKLHIYLALAFLPQTVCTFMFRHLAAQARP